VVSRIRHEVVTDTSHLGRYGRRMDDADRVLERLRRIEVLRRGHAGRAPSRDLMAELRALVPEAEAWARSEGDARAREAATELRKGAEGMR
jgi:hypothetical protein